jgi:hypothetical protein
VTISNTYLGLNDTKPHLQLACMKKLKQMELCECLLPFVQNLLSSSLLSKNIKIRIYKIIIFLVLYICVCV